MQQRIVKIFVIIYAVIISVPLVFVLLKIKVEPQNKLEKKISLNFKRNFPLRADLFKLYAKSKENVFGAEILPYAVVDAKNGWKFLGNKFSNALSESKGLVVFSPRELALLKANILARKKWLDKQDIKFYISVAPNKHSIYGDMIPIKKMGRKTKLEQLDSLCNKIGVQFINLGAHFPTNDSLRLYHKTDSHWNHLGGFYAFTSKMETISNDFKTKKFNLHTIDDIEIETFNAPIGDLNRALFLEQNEEFINVKLKNPFSFTKIENRLVPPFDFRFGAKNYEERYTSNINDLKIIVLRDSFFGAYFEFIADNFGESIFVWRHNFNKELIISEKPNIVCYEIVERNLDILLSPNFNHSPD